MARGICSFGGVCYHGDIDLDAPVYKFYSLQRFLEAVNNGRMYFRNILYWDDNWELPTRLFNTNDMDENSSFFINKDRIFPTFASCFTSRFDTDSMWRIYSPNKSGVCIETTARALLKEMAKFDEPGFSAYYAPVIYIDADISSPEAIFNQKLAEEYPAHYYMPYIKRDAFSYEHEMRLVVRHGQIYRDIRGFFVPVNMHSIIKKVILDPRLTKEEVSYHKPCMEKLGFQTEQSTLFLDVKFNGKDYVQWINRIERCTTISGTKLKIFEP